MIKVSIILISKNVEKYIEECLKSLVEQTLNEIEILCVDAFSNDKTRSIIEAFMKKDDRIILLDDEKGSTGFANNLGIEKARGEYIAFAEADDLVTPDMYKTLYEVAKANDLDYVKSNYFSFYDSPIDKRIYSKVKVTSNASIYGKVISPSDYPHLITDDSNTWTGLYKRDFAKKYIQENETPGAAYQDIGFMLCVHINAIRAMYIDNHFYCYRKGRAGASMCNPKGIIALYNEIKLNISYLEKCNVDDRQWIAYYKKILKSPVLKTIPKVFYDNGEKLILEDKIIHAYRQIGKVIGSAFSNNYITISDDGFDLCVQAQLLAYDVEAYIRYQYYAYKVLKENQKKVIYKAKENDQVIIFGAGDSGLQLYQLLVDNEITSVKAFCDNNVSIQNSCMYSMEILSLDMVLSKFEKPFFIIANEVYYDQIILQLKKAGISDADYDVFRLC